MNATRTESIYESIKKLRGIGDEDDNFDSDLVLCINSSLSVLTQLGVGPDEGFSISTGQETWADFMGESKLFNMAVDFVNMRVWLLFDPPTNASLYGEIDKMINELVWRLSIAADEVKDGE